MNKEELLKHRLALEEAEKRFDKERNLITGEVGEHAYHTKLIGEKIHSTRESLSYAVALLYAEDENYTKRAEKIIKRIIEIQDTNPESNTFGIWPYYEEEPPEKMDAPDRNWADFLGKQLVEILYVHKDKLSKELIEPIENACRYACEAILRRDEGVQYTNIAFMDALVTISTGELLGEEKYFSYGIDKLERFLGFYKFHGGVFEFNSPCYTPLITRDAGTFLKLVKNKEAKENAKKVNELCWKMIAQHFRADMLQLAGPHSRAYSDYIDDQFLYEIELACEGEVSFECEKKFGIETFWTKAYCPKEYRGYFKGEKKPESTEKIIIRGFNYPFFAFCQTATTYHAPNFTLGTFNREELWNQRRPLLGYIKGKEKPYCLRVRALHDGYDFSSAALHCVQEKSTVLGVVNFSSDRGDTHVGLDKAVNAEYETLEITFEITGDMAGISFDKNETEVKITVGGVKIEINIIGAKFGQNEIDYKIKKEKDKLIYSVVLYSGKKRKIDLTALEAAYVCFTLDIDSISTGRNIDEDDKYIKAECEAFGKKMTVKSLKTALPFMKVMYDDMQTKDGKRLESIAKR